MKENMPFSFEEREDDRLDSEEAQVEANMLRVKLKEVVGHEPTAEDYDKALAAVEEMKEAAAKEPEFDKHFFQVLQIGSKYFDKGIDALVKVITLGKLPIEGDRRNMFEDAELRLKQLREQAEKMAG